MPKSSGLGQRFFLGGYDLSGDIGAFNVIRHSRAVLDATDITQSAHARLYGLREGEINFNSFFDIAVGQSHPVLKALPTSDLIAMVFTSTTLGDPVAALIGNQIDYDPKRGSAGDLLFTTQVLSDSFGLEWCEALTAGKRTDIAAANGASIDRQAYGLVGVSSAFGAAAYLEVFSFTGTSITVKVQDSADNATFADVTGLTFTAVAAAPAQQRVETALNATIRRYLRVISTGTFNPCTFAVACISYLDAPRDP